VPDAITRIHESSDWREYYSAYADAYRSLFEDRLALGRVDLVGQLHHTAIPDASGTMCGIVNWAAYSQPSPPTLSAFLELFGELVKMQPQRIRSSRYIFLTPDGEPLAYGEAGRRIGGEADKIDYCCDSFSMALAVATEYGPIDSLNVLAAAAHPLVRREEMKDTDGQAGDKGRLQAVRNRLLGVPLTGRSVIPPMLVQPFIDSCFVLTAYRLGLPLEDTAAFCEGRGGIGAHLALERARESRWNDECIIYCTRLLDQCPARAIDYVVKPGDMLSRIVRREYGMSFDRLWPVIHGLNPEIRDPNLIRAGQVIRLPHLG